MEKKYFLLLCALCVVGALALLPYHTAAAAGPPTLVQLKGESDEISPQTVTVKLGNAIIWHNNGPGPVTIKFITRIGLACAAPVNFYADLLGNYETTKIPVGGTASICLIEEGNYEYEVRRLISKDKEKPYELITKGTVKAAK